MPARTRHAKLDPIEHLIERALLPGQDIPYGAMSAFIASLDAVAANIVELQTSRPADAARLWEAFIAGCVVKIEQVDDSCGGLGDTIRDALCSWIGARQAASADPADTAETIHRWMDRDEYGFFDSCISPRVAAALDAAGLAAFDAVIRRAIAAGGPADPVAPSWRRPVAATCGTTILKAIAAARHDAVEFEALCRPDGTSPNDCELLATIHMAQRKPGEALAWVERGLELEKVATRTTHHGHGLERLRRELLVAVGRGPEVLEIAWQAFTAAPSADGLADVLRLTPRRERATARGRALATALRRDLRGCLDVCLALGALDQLAARILAADAGEMKLASACATGAAAKQVRRKHPAAAAKLYRALALNPIEARWTGGYSVAIAHLEAAKACYESACDVGEWEQLVAILRTDHKRLQRIQAGLDNILAGTGPSTEPSFLQRAKARWRERTTA